MVLTVKNKEYTKEVVMEEKGIKISLAVIQSFIVVLLGYSLSFVKETDILLTTMIALYVLHYIVFYFSNYGQDFFRRGNFIEFVCLTKYIIFFALAIVSLISF